MSRAFLNADTLAIDPPQAVNVSRATCRIIGWTKRHRRMLRRVHGMRHRTSSPRRRDSVRAIPSNVRHVRAMFEQCSSNVRAMFEMFKQCSKCSSNVPVMFDMVSSKCWVCSVFDMIIMTECWVYLGKLQGGTSIDMICSECSSNV